MKMMVGNCSYLWSALLIFAFTQEAAVDGLSPRSSNSRRSLLKLAAGDGDTTYAKAPPVKLNLYDEMAPTLYMSSLAYEITTALNKAESGKIKLEIPKDSPIPEFQGYLKEGGDFTSFNKGDGISFQDIDTFLLANKEEFNQAFEDGQLVRKVVDEIREDLAPEKRWSKNPMKRVFLTHHRSIQQDVACVYSVIKDTITKRIIVSFRGSTGIPFVTTRDWQTNLNALPVELETPDQIKDKMKGIQQKRVLAHKGFYKYLFNNKRMRGKQQYDNVIDDIRKAINNESGYSVYVTGHSLGGALATMFSMKLAGSGQSFDDIPRPVTCITFAAPFSGTRGYRTAIEHMERYGLIRHLRVNNEEDLVPALPPLSLFRKRLMKHTGINLRLTSSEPRIEHTSQADLSTAILNSVLKPLWLFPGSHLLPLHEERMEALKDELERMKLDDLYKDEAIVSKDFIEETIGENDW